jgi:hypothetical protein
LEGFAVGYDAPKISMMSEVTVVGEEEREALIS